MIHIRRDGRENYPRVSRMKLTAQNILRKIKVLKHCGKNCWCNPELLQVCPEDEDGWCPAECYRCGGEGVVATYDPFEALIIVHRDL